MNVLIKSAIIVDPKSDFQNETCDILIENGIILQISKQIPNSSKVREIKLDNLHVSQGWFDSSVSFGEPGFEERETLLNGLETAAYSGFTDVAVNSNTNPVIDNYTNIAFLKAKSHDHPVQLHPI